MKKGRYGIVLLLVLLMLIPISVSADNERIKSIDTFVILEDDGTAKVRQVWDISTHKGTEFFIPITELKDMKVENFKVSDETGREFEFVENWNVKGSLEDKAFKNGINHISNGIELCWGKSSFGDHKYTVSWDYKNAVQAYSDYDGFNIRFINDKMDPVPENVSIVISKDGTVLSNENTRIWAFGYEGDIEFKGDGTVTGKSHRSLDKNEYMNIMMSFEKGIFTPSISHEESFDVLKDRAMEGATTHEKKSSTSKFPLRYVLIASILILVSVIGILTKGFRGDYIYNLGGIKINLQPKKVYRKPKDNDLDYYRGLPLDNKIIAMYYIEKIVRRMGSPVDLMASHILNWIKNDNIAPEESFATEEPKTKKDVKNVRLHIGNEPEFESETEKELWEMIVKAAGKDRILEEDEFQRYSKVNHERVSKWIDSAVINGGVKFLEMDGLEIVDEKPDSAKTMITQKGEQYINDFYGFRKFLKDFTIIQEREVKEVNLWDDYLIIATIMGMGEEVTKQMESILPSYVFGRGEEDITDSYPFYTNYLVFNTVRNMANSGIKGFSEGSYDASGGGGSSFSGGGGGFSGGGSGGGGR